MGSDSAAPGIPRDFARQVAYTARFREALLIFSHEFDARRQVRIRDPSTSVPPSKQPVINGPDPVQALQRWARGQLAGRNDLLLELPGRAG